MTFISYAQNFEDVMLWRALKHVENGFYIDVGANDPTLYSVTRAFYDQGWHGINLEPVSQFFERLRKERPRDINLQMGAGATEGSFPFFDIPDSGLATSDPAVAEMHRKEGWNVRQIQVQILPLAEICNRYVTGDIHFLKVDVEGAERAVLLGMDFRKWRPWVVVVEATVPMSQQTAHETWESLLLDADYEFVYFDGLNRYYVAAEHAELKPALSLPPNVFDGFVLNTDQESRLRADEAESRAHQARGRLLEAEARLARTLAQAQLIRAEADEAQAVILQTQATVRELETQLRDTGIQVQHFQGIVADIYASRSWKVTAPLRWLGCAARRGKSELRQAVTSPRTFAIRAVFAVLRRIFPLVERNPELAALARRLQRRFPALADRVMRRLKTAAPGLPNQLVQFSSLVQDDLPVWGNATSPAGQFKTSLLRELQKRQKSKAS
ncbi:MAG TPA: FkbM family methyltransferase [Noviherbaspirillum sp.]|nr:FkbM family methyltransferase [Noviherbaspirillum sp.]